MIEEWRDIEGYEGIYQVSNLGNVKSLERIVADSNGVNYSRKEKMLKLYVSNSGHLRVHLYKNKKAYVHFVHKLVAEAFLPNPQNLLQVKHKDRDVKNNKVSNLKWYGLLKKDNKKQRIAGKRYFDKPWYGSYRAMLYRCENPNDINYKNYGGRGISVCEEWHDVKKFEEWVESSNYKIGLTIERKNVNGNYEPSNCTWATYQEQGNNRRNTIYITANGMTKTIREWSEITGIKRKTIEKRYYSGWSEEEIINGRGA